MGILSQVKFLAWLSATLYLFSIICNQLQIMKILKNTYIKENNSLLPSPQHSHSAYTVWKCLGWVMRKVALCNTILFKRVPKQVKGLFLLKKKNNTAISNKKPSYATCWNLTYSWWTPCTSRLAYRRTWWHPHQYQWSECHRGNSQTGYHNLWFWHSPVKFMIVNMVHNSS